MAARPRKSRPTRPAVAKTDASGVRSRPADQGLSLEAMQQGLAERLSAGAAPYEGEGADEPPPLPAAPPGVAPELAALAAQVAASDSGVRRLPEDDACEITPRSILEAMLFVGDAGDEPLRPQRVAELMRGVRPAEIDDLVEDLNEEYAANRCPYTIESHGGGYRLALSPEYAAIPERVVGRAKRAKLSQAAIETLAAVAYHQPISGDRVSELRGSPSGAILSQLVRRELLEIRRDPGERKQRYATTARFLEFFGLTSLDDLPRGQDVETR